jgi:predicted metal-dependent hydrolase
MTNNQDRAGRCQAALEIYGDDDLATNLIDLLADAQHWADQNGHEFPFLLACACRHYIHELNDQQRDERRMIP